MGPGNKSCSSNFAVAIFCIDVCILKPGDYTLPFLGLVFPLLTLSKFVRKLTPICNGVRFQNFKCKTSELPSKKRLSNRLLVTSRKQDIISDRHDGRLK